MRGQRCAITSVWRARRCNESNPANDIHADGVGCGLPVLLDIHFRVPLDFADRRAHAGDTEVFGGPVHGFGSNLPHALPGGQVTCAGEGEVLLAKLVGSGDIAVGIAISLHKSQAWKRDMIGEEWHPPKAS
jgi:hypothetical protein